MIELSLRRTGCLVMPLLVLALAACDRSAPPAAQARLVVTQVVAEHPGDVGSNYAGEVRPRVESPLSFRVGGKILERRVNVGDRVVAGQVLARLDPADVQLQWTQSEAQRELAESEAHRYRELRERNFVSQSALDAKETTARAARAQADLARNQTAYTTLTADGPGVISAISAEAGQVVGAGQSVMTLARLPGQPDDLEVAITVPESRMGDLRVGELVRVSLWANPDKPYGGRIREIAPMADLSSRTYGVRVTVQDPDATMRLGMTANVLRLRGERGPGRGLLVPATALFQQGHQHALWVVDANNTLALRPVTVKAYREDGVVIDQGVTVGERIVVAGVHKLTPGEPVRYRSEADGALQGAVGAGAQTGSAPLDPARQPEPPASKGAEAGTRGRS